MYVTIAITSSITILFEFFIDESISWAVLSHLSSEESFYAAVTYSFRGPRKCWSWKSHLSQPIGIKSISSRVNWAKSHVIGSISNVVAVKAPKMQTQHFWNVAKNKKSTFCNNCVYFCILHVFRKSKSEWCWYLRFILLKSQR